MEKKQHLKEAEAKRREQLQMKQHKKDTLDKIEADKIARREKAAAEKAKREGRAEPVEVQAPIPTPSTPAASKPASAYNETRLRLCLDTPNDNIQKTFPVEATLFEVASVLSSERGIQAQSFVQTYPKKTFDQVDFGATLKELGLFPSASLNVKW